MQPIKTQEPYVRPVFGRHAKPGKCLRTIGESIAITLVDVGSGRLDLTQYLYCLSPGDGILPAVFILLGFTGLSILPVTILHNNDIAPALHLNLNPITFFIGQECMDSMFRPDILDQTFLTFGGVLLSLSSSWMTHPMLSPSDKPLMVRTS